MKFEEIPEPQPMIAEYVIRLTPNEAEVVCVQLGDAFISSWPKSGVVYDIYTKLLERKR